MGAFFVFNVGVIITITLRICTLKTVLDLIENCSVY